MQIKFNKDHIPVIMNSLPHFVGVRLVPKPDGRTDKIPVDVNTGFNAKTNDLETWCSFSEAVAAYEAGRVDTIGFCFTKESRIIGIDLDHCFSGDKVKPDIAMLINSVDSYTEISQSGSGIHIITIGKIPRSIKTKQIEIYDSGRYFALTGNILPGFGEVNQSQTALDALIASLADTMSKPVGKATQPRVDRFTGSTAEVIEKIRNSRQGALFERLWCGDVSSYTSNSEADSALCFMLAFWFGDFHCIDAIFRQSALYRPGKWDKRHHANGSTYGQETINRALALVRVRFEGNRRRKQDA